jgi:CBS domain-containing protein
MITMVSARDIMSPNVECVGEQDTLVDAARKMASLDVGALPICGDDERLKGMLTDRDIVVKVVAQGGDPAGTRAGSLAEGPVITVRADDDIEAVLDLMQQHQVRRIPVIDDHRLVGIISQADIALSMSSQATGQTVEEISADEP